MDAQIVEEMKTPPTSPAMAESLIFTFRFFQGAAGRARVERTTPSTLERWRRRN